MKDSLTPGLMLEQTFAVTPEMGVKHFGPGIPPVLNSPSMILLIEITCSRLLAPYFGENEQSVGFHVDVRHLAPTRIGQSVTVTVRLEEISDRRFRFAVEAKNDQGIKIGVGTHRRALINLKEFAG
jgi:fluoroacetyl-CoA thioesterase